MEYIASGHESPHAVHLLIGHRLWLAQHPSRGLHDQVTAGVDLEAPSFYGTATYAQAGGLVSYGVDYAEGFRKSADYVDKVLKGAKRGDLPVEQPTKFELVVNLKTAKALGIKIPESILLRADEVIR